MINDLLHYDLKIYQDEKYFKFSIDSVLLAEFVEINYRDKNIIDLCTGNAPIPMILSTKFNKNIVGVELQKEIYELGKRSIDINSIKNVSLINKNVKDIVNNFDYKFDIVTCNPPYFKYSDSSIINNNSIKSIARHEIEVDLETIISISSKLLRRSGKLYLVHRTDRFIELLDFLKKYKFGLRKLEFVYDNKDKESCFFLVEAKYLCKDDLKMLKPLYIDEYLEELWN